MSVFHHFVLLEENSEEVGNQNYDNGNGISKKYKTKKIFVYKVVSNSLETLRNGCCALNAHIIWLDDASLKTSLGAHSLNQKSNYVYNVQNHLSIHSFVHIKYYLLMFISHILRSSVVNMLYLQNQHH